jgi:transposase-like protein
MPRIPKSKWVEARIRWETSPDVTFAEIARQLGVHPATVHERARREGWVKVARHEARPVGSPCPESVEAYRKNATEVAQLHAKLLARARADLELFRSKLMRAIEAADDADIVRYATAFGVYLDRLYVHILREREVWGLTESGAPEIRIVRRGWVVVGSNGSSDGSSNGSSNGDGSD